MLSVNDVLLQSVQEVRGAGSTGYTGPSGPAEATQLTAPRDIRQIRETMRRPLRVEKVQDLLRPTEQERLNLQREQVRLLYASDTMSIPNSVFFLIQ